jgi:hypothetical protein
MSVAVAAYRIGAPSHLKRNLWLAIAALAGTVAIGGFYASSARTEHRELDALTQFRAAAGRCGWEEPVPDVAEELYLASSRVRAAVDAQRAALEAGADCGDVLTALHAADFPAQGPRPVIHLPPVIISP